MESTPEIEDIAESFEKSVAQEAISKEGLERHSQMISQISSLEIFAAMGLLINSKKFMKLPGADAFISLVAGMDTVWPAQIKEIQSLRARLTPE